MPKAAYLWIRDGVLIDRMPLNAAAFAVSMFEFSPQLSLEDLINFAFEKSGVSCAEKVEMFKAERAAFALEDAQPVVDRYAELSSLAGPRCSYFDGVVQLLTELQDSGHANFITSAISQDELDAWLAGDQGSAVRPLLREAMGRRASFAKGEPHFRHVHDLDFAPIYLVADAVAEISLGASFAEQFGVVPIGFANVIEPHHIEEALRLIEAATGARFGSVQSGQLRLPDKSALVSSLKKAGAKVVVTGTPSEIIGILKSTLSQA
jgi:phosphoglycolate phosphatase-like HAD superfamily hydrolase